MRIIEDEHRKSKRTYLNNLKDERQYFGESLLKEDVKPKPEFEHQDGIKLADKEETSLTTSLPPETEESDREKKRSRPPILKCGCLDHAFLVKRIQNNLLRELTFFPGAGKGLLSTVEIEAVCSRWIYALERQEDFYSSYKKVEAAIARGLPLPPSEGIRYIKILNTISGSLIKGKGDTIGVRVRESLYDDIVKLMEAYEGVR